MPSKAVNRVCQARSRALFCIEESVFSFLSHLTAIRRVVIRRLMPSHCRIWDQTNALNGHPKKRCLANSFVLMHNEHEASSCRNASRSHVASLPRSPSHKMNEYFDGMNDFHTAVFQGCLVSFGLKYS
ncbi:hypothetical protein Salat_2929500 [Sesamum alatum]|uniref:Uncharacterized protein n=1 Tax=Sesamum alatum TaxID=300844 RepID=A0AAE1XJA2_9LAMI|nr:hypothetical protein Salat_2929500 [Sesamum alatum]